jgi:TRAP-type C4-dicarboxylate transport system permease small subunit
MMATLDAVERVLIRLERWILVGGLAVMVLVNVGLIVSRPIPWLRLGVYFDLLIGLMPWVAMIGLAIGIERNRHIGFVAVANALPLLGRKMALAVAGVATAGFFGILIWGGILLVQTQMRMGLSTPSMGMPAWWFSASVPVGASLALFHLMLRLVRVYRAGTEEAVQFEEGADG